MKSFAGREKGTRGTASCKNETTLMNPSWLHPQNPAGFFHPKTLVCSTLRSCIHRWTAFITQVTFTIKSINSWWEVRCVNPLPLPPQSNTTAHLVSCRWIYSSSLNLPSQIDKRGTKPVGETWKRDFFLNNLKVSPAEWELHTQLEH